MNIHVNLFPLSKIIFSWWCNVLALYTTQLYFNASSLRSLNILFAFLANLPQGVLFYANKIRFILSHIYHIMLSVSTSWTTSHRFTSGAPKGSMTILAYCLRITLSPDFKRSSFLSSSSWFLAMPISFLTSLEQLSQAPAKCCGHVFWIKFKHVELVGLGW